MKTSALFIISTISMFLSKPNFALDDTHSANDDNWPFFDCPDIRDLQKLHDTPRDSQTFKDAKNQIWDITDRNEEIERSLFYRYDIYEKKLHAYSRIDLDDCFTSKLSWLGYISNKSEKKCDTTLNNRAIPIFLQIFTIGLWSNGTTRNITIQLR